MPHYLRERYQISPVFVISPTVISQQGGAVSYERQVSFGATMVQVNAVFSHRRLLGIAETDVSVMSFDPRLSRTASLTEPG
jgi:hypothetical protein